MTDEIESVYPDCPGIVRTVEVGGLTKAELLQEFRTHSISMNAYGTKLFEDAAWEPSEFKYCLQTVELMVRQLGFPAGAVSDDIFTRAEQLGLSLCPLEAGPFMRLQYLEQPEGFWITIASRPLYDDLNFPNGFYLRRLEDGLWLRGYTATPDHLFDPSDHFIFCRREDRNDRNGDAALF